MTSRATAIWILVPIAISLCGLSAGCSGQQAASPSPTPDAAELARRAADEEKQFQRQRIAEDPLYEAAKEWSAVCTAKRGIDTQVTRWTDAWKGGLEGLRYGMTPDRRNILDAQREIPRYAGEVRDAVRRMPAKSRPLTPAKQKQLAVQIQVVDRLRSAFQKVCQATAQRDDVNLRLLQENQRKLLRALIIIEDLYPKGQLDESFEPHGTPVGKPVVERRLIERD